MLTLSAILLTSQFPINQCNFDIELKCATYKRILSGKDSDGCGAEVVAPRDAPLSFVFRRKPASTCRFLKSFWKPCGFCVGNIFLGNKRWISKPKQCNICNSNRDLRAAHVPWTSRPRCGGKLAKLCRWTMPWSRTQYRCVFIEHHWLQTGSNW